MKDSEPSCVCLPGRVYGAVSQIIFMKFSNMYCARFDSVKNIIQNDSVSPCLARLRAKRGRRLHKVTFQGPLPYGSL